MLEASFAQPSMKWVEAVSGDRVKSTVAVPPAGTVSASAEALRVSEDTSVEVASSAALVSVMTCWAGTV